MRKSQNHPFGIAARDLEHLVEHARADLEELRGKKVFITGGTGFFGKWLLAELLFANDELDLGLKMTVLSRDPAAFLGKHSELGGVAALKMCAGDVASFPFDDHRPDYVIHAATETTVPTTETDERARARTIIDGTAHVLSFVRTSRAHRLLNISSGGVYGAAATQLDGARETDSASPVTPYGVAKLEAENLCAQSGLDFVTARAFAFLGPHLPLDAHFAAGNFLRDALRGGPIVVRGDGTALRSYLHPADLVVWLLRLLIRGERSQAYNVGSDESVTTAQLAKLIADAVEPKAQVVIQSTQPQGPQNVYLPNIARARIQLGLNVAIPLRDSIKRTLDTYLRR